MGAAGEMVRIHLSDGSFFSLYAEIFAREGISTGTTLEPGRVAALTSRSEEVGARLRALSLIARAPQTRRRLAQKLRARSFGPDAVRAALERMSELGYLDDRSFAEDWTRSRLSSRNEGWKSLYRGLIRAGVPRAIAEETLDRMFSDEMERESALRCVEDLSRNAAIRRLTSRGFRSRTIARVLREMGPGNREAPRE